MDRRVRTSRAGAGGDPSEPPRPPNGPPEPSRDPPWGREAPDEEGPEDGEGPPRPIRLLPMIHVEDLLRNGSHSSEGDVARQAMLVHTVADRIVTEAGLVGYEPLCRAEPMVDARGNPLTPLLYSYAPDEITCPECTLLSLDPDGGAN